MLAFNLLAEDGLEFPTLLTVSTCLSKCWDYSHLPPHPVYMMLETEPWTPQALYQLSHSHRALISCLWVIFFLLGVGAGRDNKIPLCNPGGPGTLCS